MTNTILTWIRLRWQWYRLWCSIADLKWVAKVGRDNESIYNQPLFKCFEAWVDHAQLNYDDGLLQPSEYAASKAVAAFNRMPEPRRMFLSKLAQAARMTDYRMRVAHLCQ
ncbi:MAG: hypothetical protein SGJ27_20635 [Candidatus Melainabacteria bacterium]|nr:hypothetical protein [Candidatus Melainabacteria bacterium]